MTSHNGHSTLNERIDSIASDLKSVADRLAAATAELEDRAVDVTSQARSGARALAGRASRAIQDHPIAAIGIALGAGYLVMRLIRR